MKNYRSFLTRTKNMYKKFNNLLKTESYYKPGYRVVNIEQDETGNYQVVIQLIGKSIVFKSKPEELLADNKIVNLFSPCDVRTLTYLGYLGINSPKYKILAKRLSEEHDQTFFALSEKGKKTYTTATANEISSNAEIIQGMSQEDAHTIGFTVAAEQILLEKKQQEELQKQSTNTSKNAKS